MVTTYLKSKQLLLFAFAGWCALRLIFKFIIAHCGLFRGRGSHVKTNYRSLLSPPLQPYTQSGNAAEVTHSKFNDVLIRIKTQIANAIYVLMRVKIPRGETLHLHVIVKKKSIFN